MASAGESWKKLVRDGRAGEAKESWVRSGESEREVGRA